MGARALKSAIDSLRSHLDGATVLDLYAGQGRFGFAALEAGAAKVVMVEKSARNASELLRLRPKKIPVERELVVVNQTVESFLAHAKNDLYDIVFADPPFPLWEEKGLEMRFMTDLRSVMKQDSIFLVKYPSRMVIFRPHLGFRPWKESRFGESLLAYFIYEKDSKDEDGKIRD